MRISPLIFLIMAISTGCEPTFEGIERDPALKEIEEKMISDLDCEDAIITSGYDSIGTAKGQALRLIFINSKKINLADPDKVNDEWCNSISDKFVDNFLEQNHPYTFIQVKLVERKVFLVTTKKYYAHMYLISTFEDQQADSTENM